MNNDYERNKYNDKPSGTKKLNNINSNDNLQNYLLEQAYNKDNELEEPLDLNKIKDKADRYNKLRDKKINSTNSSNANKNLINNIKKNVNNKNSSVENYNDYQEEYTNLNTEITKTRPLSEYINDDSEFQNFLENLEETVIN
jgi:multidrug resistance efflux pump